LLDLSTRLALRPKEAAEAMGIGERTLRQMLPELPHVRVGTTVLLPVEGLREWLKEHAESERSHVDQAVDEILDSVSKG
jgi:excisionase family DNA binding protein